MSSVADGTPLANIPMRPIGHGGGSVGVTATETFRPSAPAMPSGASPYIPSNPGAGGPMPHPSTTPVQQPPPNTGMDGANSNSIDPATAQRIAAELQHVAATMPPGTTTIPTRDMPMNPAAHMIDPASVNPNYIPPPLSSANGRAPHTDYVGQYADAVRRRNDGRRVRFADNGGDKEMDSLEQFYRAIQVPLLVGVLYLLFQMSIFRAQLQYWVPTLFQEDGTYHLSGYLFVSALFGILYYLISQLTAVLGGGAG